MLSTVYSKNEQDLVNIEYYYFKSPTTKPRYYLQNFIFSFLYIYLTPPYLIIL